MEAGAQQLSGDDSNIVYTFLREDVVKIAGVAKTEEMARIGEKLEVSKSL